MRKEKPTTTIRGGALSLNATQADVVQEMFCKVAMPANLVTTMSPVFTQLERLTGKTMTQRLQELAQGAAAAPPGQPGA